ncbi:MAG: hypothetical protein JW794_02570 [Candidatus Cloacimonetes bacterium]|nr:hypothetical protein [Candidatus Cloacimonadota bacterium]
MARYSLLRHIACVVIFVSMILGCSMMSSMQTGRTMKKGDVGLGIGYGSLFENDDSKIFSNYHFWELNLRYGLFKNFDFGLEFIAYLPTTLDVKYQFAGTDSSLFASSIGLGFTIQSVQFGFKEVGFLLPLYTSFHPVKEVALFLSPRVYYYHDSSNWVTYAGLSTGFRLGGTCALILEYDIYKIISTDSRTVSQALVGLSYNIP